MSERTAWYVRDPDNVIGDEAIARRFDNDSTLPAAARDSGLRRHGVALWAVPADASAVYLVGRRVEKWPRDLDPSFCA
jgi:hypothetical protein